MTVPFLLDKPYLLQMFLFEKKILDLVLDLVLSQSKNRESLDAINALSIVAFNLGISCTLPNVEALRKCDGLNNLNESIDQDLVTFVLSDNLEISCSKVLLMAHSEVFERMFSSDFREGRENKVSLKSISIKAMKSFLQSLINCKACDKPCSNLESLEMTELIEAYYLSKMYLISKLENLYLIRIKQLISYLNAHIVVQMSFNNNDEDLLIFALQFCLSCDTCNSKKLDLFERLGQCVEKKDVQALLKDIIYKNM